MMLKRLFVPVVCLLLQACAVVGSKTPLFTPADAASAPLLRLGLWAMPDTDCKDFDPAAAPDKWPECANLIIVRATTVGGNEHEDDGSIKKRELPYVLAAGDPRILQLAAPDDRKPDQPAYLYVGMRPTKQDPQGRVVEGRIWLVMCSEPPASEHYFDKHKPKLKPLPGLKVVGDTTCLAETQGPVRNAAAKTEGWLSKGEITDAIITAHWVRDGEK